MAIATGYLTKKIQLNPMNLCSLSRDRVGVKPENNE